MVHGIGLRSYRVSAGLSRVSVGVYRILEGSLGVPTMGL